jgi:hypothetical protein
MSLAPLAIALNVLPKMSPFQREALVLASSKYGDDYNDDYDQPAEEYSGRTQRRYSSKDQSLPGLGGLLKNQRQLGAGLLGVGMLLTFMGMMLFFEGTLLRLGNVSPKESRRYKLFMLLRTDQKVLIVPCTPPSPLTSWLLVRFAFCRYV